MRGLFIFTVGIFGTYGIMYIKKPCPEVKAVENFDLYKYTKSRWYEIAKYPNDLQRKGDCMTLNFLNKTDGIRFKLTEVVNGELTYMEGSYKLAPEAGMTGITQIHSQNVTQEEAEDSLLLYILDTDYDNYAVVYDCRYNETIETRHDYAWILSRSKTLEGEPRMAMEKFIKSTGYIDMDKFIWDHFTRDTCNGYV